MKKSLFVLMSLVSLSVLGTIKVVKAYTGRGIQYSHYFASSGWNTPKYLVREVDIDEEPEDSFGPYACLYNTSGINIGSDGNDGNTKHDVYAYFYGYDETDDFEFGCMSNTAGTGASSLGLHIDYDLYNYNTHFYGSYSGNIDRYRLYFKKSWNDTWSGTLSGVDYIFEQNVVPNN